MRIASVSAGALPFSATMTAAESVLTSGTGRGSKSANSRWLLSGSGVVIRVVLLAGI